MSLLIDSPKLARQFADVCEFFAPQFTHQFSITDKGRLQWQTGSADNAVIIQQYPNVNLAPRMAGKATQWLRIRG